MHLNVLKMHKLLVADFSIFLCFSQFIDFEMQILYEYVFVSYSTSLSLFIYNSFYCFRRMSL